MTVRECLQEATGALTKRAIAWRVAGCQCKGDTCTHKRDVEEAIRSLIVDEGWLIVANGKGYWITDDEAEVIRYESWLEDKEGKTRERRQAIRRARERRFTQQSELWAAA